MTTALSESLQSELNELGAEFTPQGVIPDSLGLMAVIVESSDPQRARNAAIGWRHPKLTGREPHARYSTGEASYLLYRISNSVSPSRPAWTMRNAARERLAKGFRVGANAAIPVNDDTCALALITAAKSDDRFEFKSPKGIGINALLAAAANESEELSIAQVSLQSLSSDTPDMSDAAKRAAADQLIENDCVLPCEGTVIERVEAGLELIRDSMGYFDARMHTVIDGTPVWRLSDKPFADTRAVLRESRVCESCLRVVIDGILRRLVGESWETLSPLHVPFRFGDELKKRMYDYRDDTTYWDPVYPSDKAIWNPSFDLLDGSGNPPANLNVLSAAEELILIGTMGMSECCIKRLLSWIHAAILRAQKRVPFLIANPDSGKTAFRKALTQVMVRGSHIEAVGQSVDKYSDADIMRAALVFGDEAQLIEAPGWNTLRVRTGGDEATVRGMYRSETSIPSRCSLMLLAELATMAFKDRKVWDLSGGMMKSRARFFIARHMRVLDSPREYNQVLEPSQVRLLWHRIFQTTQDGRLEECECMTASRMAVIDAIENNKGVIDAEKWGWT